MAWVSVAMPKDKTDLIYGTLDMLILRALQHESRHGLGIADRIHLISADVLRVEQGSLYPALYRLEAEGLIRAKWGISENNRKARFYELTAAGRKQLAAEVEHWERLASAISVVLAKA
jgi:PadR family transcriptional regulator, regulatory protein PadR